MVSQVDVAGCVTEELVTLFRTHTDAFMNVKTQIMYGSLFAIESENVNSYWQKSAAK